MKALCVSLWAGCWQPACQRAVHRLMHGATKRSVIHGCCLSLTASFSSLKILLGPVSPLQFWLMYKSAYCKFVSHQPIST